jgi:nitroreductase
MNFQEVVMKRHSVRTFSDKNIDINDFGFIRDIYQQAPSAGGLKSYDVHVMIKQEGKIEIAKAAANQMFIADAGMVMIFSADLLKNFWKYGMRGQNLYAIQDATIAATYAQLAATSLGLGSCWVGAFNTEEVSKILGIKSPYLPVVILPIGYEKV